jgi:hypothetical protein
MDDFNIESILNFKFELKDFLRFVPKPKENVKAKAVEHLKQIKGEKLSAPPINRVSEIYRKFIDIVLKGIQVLREGFKTRRDIKTLAWCLYHKEDKKPYDIQIAKSKFMSYAIQLFEDKYSHSILVPICENLLMEWGSSESEIFRGFVKKYISTYNGKRNLLHVIKYNEEWFLNHRGDINLASYLIEGNKKLSEVWNFLNLPEHIYQYEYFSHLAIQYTNLLLKRDYSLTHIEDIIEFLNKHNNRLADKRVLSLVIVNLGTEASQEYKDLLKNYVLEKIGDPVIESNWYPWPEASYKEKENLLRARDIFNEWINVEGIEMFFDKISRTIDPEDFKYRKAFWLAYAKYIEAFKIAGDRSLRYSLERDDKTRGIVKNRFAILGSAERDQCAFIFKIRGYVFVEFGKKGAAFYAYRASNPFAPRLDKQLYSIYELRKHSEMAYLMREEDNNKIRYYREGRYSHFASKEYFWQERLSWWLDKVLEISPTKNYKKIR